MKKLLSNRRLLLGLGLAITLVLVGLLGFYFRRLVPQLLIALAIIGATWIAAHFVARWHQRRKQRGFDVGVAAKEGIEDRKREWASWTEELERQGINRYELPFYLLVGEPQSGKSVLLQNSDLHFPFGQTRLSGIGGTRGCDWWFTEEAVILDLAGRMFTHEGGASDAMEWEAFLDLLSGFRPLCPANGVLLVIPCDGLLLDSREDAMRKASRIQESLLTLTSKLQAQLPIYVVLTKGDKVFGFAETVHRLDPSKRHQMFGWSRSAEDFEEPFDMVEVRQAFGGIVDRARALRENMLSSLRLPEGISEADRVYAFPDELEALFPNLELYLKRIFSESTLVDRLYFRGMYLTSGLQVGAPIANVCSKLLGSEGEADQRDLEALFSKQQAYFIKDLIRRRVFSERGLVRPTKGRVARAQRNAWIGYGAAALIAAASVIWSVAYAIGDYEESEVSAFQRAVRAGAQIANTVDPSIDEVRQAMDLAWSAKAIEPRSLEGAAVSREQSFARLYMSLCDEQLIPALRRQAEADLQARLTGEDTPQGSEELLTALSHATTLLGDLDAVEEAERFDPSSPSPEGLLGILSSEELRRDARRLLLQRGELETPAPRSAPSRKMGQLQGELADSVDWLEDRIDRLLEFDDEYQVEGQVGYLLAWEAILDSGERVKDLAPDGLQPESFEDHRSEMYRFHAAAIYIEGPDNIRHALVAVDKGRGLSSQRISGELGRLETARDRFLGAARGGATSPETTWQRRSEVQRFLESVAFPPAGGIVDEVADLVADSRLVVPTEGLEGWLNSPLVAVCDPTLLPSDASAPLELPRLLEEAAIRARESDSDEARRILLVRQLMLQDAYIAGFVDHETLAAALHDGSDLPEPERLDLLLGHLTALDNALSSESPGDRMLHEDWRDRGRQLIQETLEEADRTALAGAAELNVSLLQTLSALMQGDHEEKTEKLAGEHFYGHMGGVAQRQLEGWQGRPVSGQDTLDILGELGDLLAQMRSAFPPSPGAFLAPVALTSWFQETEEEVRKRLEEHFKNLNRASKLPVEFELPKVASAIRDILEPEALNSWQGSLEKYDLPDLDSLSQTTLDSLQSWRALEDVSRELTDARGRFRTVAGWPGSDRLDLLVDDFAEPLRNPAASKRGPELAVLLQEVRAKRSELIKSPPESAWEHYFDRLTDHLDSRCVESLRRSYVSDLETSMEKRRSLQEALYATDLAGLKAEARDISADLATLLNSDGSFAALQAKYLQSQASSLQFLPTDDFPAQELADWWAFDRFARELQLFLLQNDSAGSVAGSEVEVWLVNSQYSAVEEGSVWLIPFFFSSFDEEQMSSEVERLGMMWGFDSEDLFLRWSKSSGAGQQDDVEVEAGSSLAPLLLCWTYGTAPTDPMETRWSIEIPRKSGGSIEFDLDFDRPIPARPAKPWEKP